MDKNFPAEKDELICSAIKKILVCLIFAFRKKSKIGYGSIYAADFITNRLAGDSLGTYDPFLRVLKIVRDDGKKSTIFS